MNTTLAPALLISLALGLGACATSVSEDTSASENALSRPPAQPPAHAGRPAAPAAIQLTNDNCTLETSYPLVYTDAPEPVICYPTGDLAGRSALLRSAYPERYTIGRHVNHGRAALGIVDVTRPWTQAFTAFNGFQRVGDPYFFVVEEPSVVLVEGTTGVSELDPGALEVSGASILAVSRDLAAQEASIRDAFHGEVLAQWRPGSTSLQGEPLAPRACAKATVVMKAEAGGFLPNEDGLEIGRPPLVVGFFCND